uniref:Uncharacterized protein n=1 Tax=Craspedostauros australis TaxID=1486917 RepID=A0A7R9WUT5_9STRA|mmetsp:Transcript_20530/g.57122  ORF Transcript_20530/g.57122 Transcript_20530/m.57122 type:complete len:296 (+) Transcript_20530:130-1017(+)
MFNADLALSVTMTAISTLLSVVMLPVNLIIYTTSTYSSAVVKSLHWSTLFISLVVVIGGISTGLFCSAYYSSHRFNLLANKIGNVAGVSLVIFSASVSSSSNDSSLWDQDIEFYFGVAAPALLGVIIASYMATKFNLDKPERVAVSVEACYQNTGIATSIAVAMFDGDEEARAVGVPLFYGICEAVILATFCIICWKMGWTKAPANENLCTVLATSYEVEGARRESPNAIEVVYGTAQQKEGDENIDDLVFTQTNDGYEFDENSRHEQSNAQLASPTAGAADANGEVPAAGRTID